MSVPFEDVAEVVSVQLGCREARPGDRLLEDLGAESADLLNLTAAVEDRFEIEIGEEELAALGTVADLHRLVARLLEEPRGRPG